jgi:lysyl-tRNA synthetase class 1
MFYILTSLLFSIKIFMAEVVLNGKSFGESWVFLEAEKILKKIEAKTPEKGFVAFETGYGPSGLPHIGTFGEVMRTSFVKFAFDTLVEKKIPTKLLCISDDLDGLRKVPDNVPNRDMVKENLGKPLTSVPDPFGTHSSYGEHMNARLRAFLDKFDFEYEFISATEMYKSGKFNDMLLRVVENYEKLMELMLKNLGEERQETYSPLMPISPETGKVLAEGVKGVNKEKGTVIYINETGKEVEVPVINGSCKMQWKIDFGARWQGLDIDYEIFGKDHAPNAKIYQEVCKILGGKGPINFVYELFLGEKGDKISKSKGNGITIDEWLKYAPKESLGLYMYEKPGTAKRLYFDVIPKKVDEYIKHIKAYENQTEIEKYGNPVYFVHFGNVPFFDLGEISYSLLLNLVSVAGGEDENVIWGFLAKYNSHLSKGKIPFLDKIVSCAINYYNDFIKPTKVFRKPNEKELEGLKLLRDFLKSCADEIKAEEIQNKVYSIGKELEFDLKNWFCAIYEVLLGQKEGPRVGSFIKIYGITNSIALIEKYII